jgi:hypothetical protein
MRPSPRRSPPLHALLKSALLGAILGIPLAGCGHPATREECDEVFNRSAELELQTQHITDPKRVAAMISDLREKRGEQILQHCVGKRITQSAMECVRRSMTPLEIERCLD